MGLKEEEAESKIYEGRFWYRGFSRFSRGRDAIPSTSGDNGGILDTIFINSGRFAGGGLLSWLPARPLTLTLIYIPAANGGGRA